MEITEDLRKNTILNIINIICEELNENSKIIPCKKHLIKTGKDLEEQLYHKKNIDHYINKKKLKEYVGEKCEMCEKIKI